MATKNTGNNTAETKTRGFQPGTGGVISFFIEDEKTGAELDMGYKYLTVAELKKLVEAGGKNAVKSRIRLSEEGLAAIE